MKNVVLNVTAALFVGVLVFFGWYLISHRSYLKARWLVFQAEQKFYAARSRSDLSKEERVPNFKKACDYFLRAYELDRRAFNYNRAQYAYESCSWVEDVKHSEMFNSFMDELEPQDWDRGGESLV